MLRIRARCFLLYVYIYRGHGRWIGWIGWVDVYWMYVYLFIYPTFFGCDWAGEGERGRKEGKMREEVIFKMAIYLLLPY